MTHVYVLIEHAHKRQNEKTKKTELADAIVRGVYATKLGAIIGMCRLGSSEEKRGYLAILRKSVKGLL